MPLYQSLNVLFVSCGLWHRVVGRYQLSWGICYLQDGRMFFKNTNPAHPPNPLQYKTTKCHNPECHNMNLHCHKNFKSHRHVLCGCMIILNTVCLKKSHMPFNVYYHSALQKPALSRINIVAKQKFSWPLSSINHDGEWNMTNMGSLQWHEDHEKVL